MRQLLKSIIAAAVVATTAGSAIAAEPPWARGVVVRGDDIYVGSATEDFGVSYILAGAITVGSDGNPRISTRFEYHNAQTTEGFTFRSLKQGYMVDCRGRRTQLTDRRAYARNNLAGPSLAIGFDRDWVVAEEGTLLESLVDMACERTGGNSAGSGGSRGSGGRDVRPST